MLEIGQERFYAAPRFELGDDIKAPAMAYLDDVARLIWDDDSPARVHRGHHLLTSPAS
jgi:hypothetical protein